MSLDMVDLSEIMTKKCIGKVFCKLFQQLGWIIVLNKNKNTEKTVNYLKVLKQLRMTIDNKRSSITNSNDKTDFSIMIKHLDILIKHVKKDFMNKEKEMDMKKKFEVPDKGIVQYDVTTCQLQKWFKNMFKKFGCMIIAHEKGDMMRIKEYMHCLNSLYHHLKLKSRKIHDDHDLKCDMKIMMENVRILICHSRNDFKEFV